MEATSTSQILGIALPLVVIVAAAVFFRWFIASGHAAPVRRVTRRDALNYLGVSAFFVAVLAVAMLRGSSFEAVQSLVVAAAVGPLVLVVNWVRGRRARP